MTYINICNTTNDIFLFPASNAQTDQSIWYEKFDGKISNYFLGRIQRLLSLLYHDNLGTTIYSIVTSHARHGI